MHGVALAGDAGGDRHGGRGGADADARAGGRRRRRPALRDRLRRAERVRLSLSGWSCMCQHAGKEGPAPCVADPPHRRRAARAELPDVLEDDLADTVALDATAVNSSIKIITLSARSIPEYEGSGCWRRQRRLRLGVKKIS